MALDFESSKSDEGDRRCKQVTVTSWIGGMEASGQCGSVGRSRTEVPTFDLSLEERRKNANHPSLSLPGYCRSFQNDDLASAIVPLWSTLHTAAKMIFLNSCKFDNVVPLPHILQEHPTAIRAKPELLTRSLKTLHNPFPAWLSVITSCVCYLPLTPISLTPQHTAVTASGEPVRQFSMA